MIILNLKTYAESTGENNAKLLNALEELRNENPEVASKISVAPSMIELINVRKNYTELNIMSQHVDNKSAGSTTGWTTPENLLAHGIKYAVYNHSEHRMNMDTIVEDVKAIQEKGVKLVVCCENVEEAKKILEAQPFAIAYEPKELIGSGVSVTTRPEAVKEFIEAVKGKTMVLIGAGISTGEDVKNGIELGAEGYILASAFVKAEDPKQKALELAEPFVK